MSAELRRESARLWVEAYLEDLTAHGLCRITATAAYLPGIARLLWAVVFTACFAFALQQCSLLLAQFQSNEVDVSVDFSFNKEVNFPAITICNLNALRRSEVLRTRLHEYVNTTAPPTATTATQGTRATTARLADVTVAPTTDLRHLEFLTTAPSHNSTTGVMPTKVVTTTLFEPGEEKFPATGTTSKPLEPSIGQQITTQPNFVFTSKSGDRPVTKPGGGGGGPVVTTVATAGVTKPGSGGGGGTTPTVSVPGTTEKGSEVCIIAGIMLKPVAGLSCAILRQLLGAAETGTPSSINRDSGPAPTAAPVVPGFIPDGFFQTSTPGSGGMTVSDFILEVAGSYGGGNTSLLEHLEAQSQQFRFVKIDVTQHEVNYQYDEAPVVREEIALLGHQIEDMLIHCEYDDQLCHASNFTRFQSGRYGNCFTFNGDASKVLKTERAGPTYGLLMELDIQQSTDYIGQLTQSAGIRMVVHKQGEEPFPEEDGFNLSPAFKTYVGIRQVVIERKGPPYGTCRNVPTDDGAETDAGRNVTYTKRRCLHQCVTQEMIKECGCVEPTYINANARLCHVYADKEKESCLAEVDRLFKSDAICSDCEDPCRSVIFRKAISQERWPSSRYEPTLFARLAALNRTIDETLQTARLRDNYLQVVVYFEEFNFQTVTQRPALELVDLLSYIGGTLGLFAGISVLSLTEFADIILNMGYFAVRWLYKRLTLGRESDQDQETDVEVYY